MEHGSGLLAMRRRDGGGLAVDGAEDVVNGLRSIIEGHDDSLVDGSVGGSG